MVDDFDLAPKLVAAAMRADIDLAAGGWAGDPGRESEHDVFSRERLASSDGPNFDPAGLISERGVEVFVAGDETAAAAPKRFFGVVCRGFIIIGTIPLVSRRV